MKSILFIILVFFFRVFRYAAQFNIIDGYTDKLSYQAGESVTFFSPENTRSMK